MSDEVGAGKISSPIENGEQLLSIKSNYIGGLETHLQSLYFVNGQSEKVRNS